MEYSINLNLKVLNQWEHARVQYPNGQIEKIDLIDCAIAQLIEKYSREIRRGLKYNENGMVWINHEYLLKQIPLLRIKKRTLEKRLKQLVDANIIERSVERRNLHGQRAYYRMSPLYREIDEFWTDYFARCEDLDTDDKRLLLEELLPDMPMPRTFVHPTTQTQKMRSKNGRFVAPHANTDGSATADFDRSEPPNSAGYPSTRNTERDEHTTSKSASDEAVFSPTSSEDIQKIEENRTPKALHQYCPNPECGKKLREEMIFPFSRTCSSCGSPLHPKWLSFLDTVTNDITEEKAEEQAG